MDGHDPAEQAHVRTELRKLFAAFTWSEWVCFARRILEKEASLNPAALSLASLRAELPALLRRLAEKSARLENNLGPESSAHDHDIDAARIWADQLEGNRD